MTPAHSPLESEYSHHQLAVANAVPEAQCSPELLKQLDDEGEDKPEPAKLSMQSLEAGTPPCHP